MGYPSGTFSDPRPGRLTVRFQGNWVTNTGSDFGSGTLELKLRGFVDHGSGPTRESVILSSSVHAQSIELPYPGGNAVFSMGMEYVSHSFNGPSSITANRLRITCRFYPA